MQCNSTSQNFPRSHTSDKLPPPSGLETICFFSSVFPLGQVSSSGFGRVLLSFCYCSCSSSVGLASPFAFWGAGALGLASPSCFGCCSYSSSLGPASPAFGFGDQLTTGDSTLILAQPKAIFLWPVPSCFCCCYCLLTTSSSALAPSPGMADAFFLFSSTFTFTLVGRIHLIARTLKLLVNAILSQMQPLLSLS